jgi:hypothetical protein
MENKRHIGFWLLLACVAFFAGPILRTGEAMEGFVAGEVAQTRLAMGDTIGGWVVSIADKFFDGSPVAFANRVVERAQHTRDEQRITRKIAGGVGVSVSNAYNSYLQGLILQSYVLTMRLAIVAFWALFLLPMLVATVFDGLMLRAIKRAEFGSIRPATFTLAGLLVIPMLTLPVLYLTMPFTLSPLLAPVWAAIVALPLSLLVSNSQPLFGR